MTVELKKIKGSFVDKETGENKECYNYILGLPTGGYIRINPVFKNDRRILNALLPVEETKAK